MAAVGMTPEAIDLAFVPRPRPGVPSAELDGEAVLYDPATGVVSRLNPTATLLWLHFDGSSSLEDLAGQLAAIYEVDIDTIRADVLGAARQFGRMGLLEGVASEQQP